MRIPQTLTGMKLFFNTKLMLYTYFHCRFYNEGSVFDHDPETGPVFGRQQIRQKIHELNFQNCRTKIKRIDSQDTSGNDIMVRVTGDISNAGGPMRRFTQTFVLAEETRKKTSNKYFIHSDIFRYQVCIAFFSQQF